MPNELHQLVGISTINIDDPATGQLAAAAPELLEALKDLVNEMDSNYIGTGANNPDGSSEAVLIELVAKAHKAIKKAGGAK